MKGTPSDVVQANNAASMRSRARLLRQVGVEALGIGTFYILIILYFSLVAPHFLSTTNATNILSSTAIIGTVSLGQTFAIVAGGFDLSVSGVIPLACVAYPILTNAGIPYPVAMMLCILLGVSIGLANGIIVTRVRISPLITTLGMASITTGLAFSICNGLPVSFDADSPSVLDNQIVQGLPIYVFVFGIVCVLAFLFLRYAVVGRMVYSVGGSREASRLAGIRVDAVTVLVYALSGAMAGLAGLMIASELLVGSPNVGASASLQSIAAVILGGASLSGGKGGIPGTIIGVFLLGTLVNGMALMQVPSFYQSIATGAALLLAVGFGQLRQVLGRGSI